MVGDPPKTWSETIISVIHKEGKDPTVFEGCRVVSLLCIRLKILTWQNAKTYQNLSTRTKWELFWAGKEQTLEEH